MNEVVAVLVPMVSFGDDAPTLVGWRVKIWRDGEHLVTLGLFEGRDQAVERGVAYARLVADLPLEERLVWWGPPLDEASPPEEGDDSSADRWWERFAPTGG